jgi:hypothetical protein
MATKKTFIDADGNITFVTSSSPVQKKQCLNGPCSDPINNTKTKRMALPSDFPWYNQGHSYTPAPPTGFPFQPPSLSNGDAFAQHTSYALYKETPEEIFFPKQTSNSKGIKVDMELLKKGPLKVQMQFGTGSPTHIQWGIKTICTLEYSAKDVIRVKEGNIKEYKDWDTNNRCYSSVKPGFFIRVFSVY